MTITDYTDKKSADEHIVFFASYFLRGLRDIVFYNFFWFWLVQFMKLGQKQNGNKISNH